MKNSLLKNPIMWSDVPDIDVIRVGTTFYMVSTSMHTLPGCPIMKSEDLVNWELVSYVFDTLENNAAHNLLDGKGIYGQGSWAASLRFNDETFYICFSSNDMKQFYVYRTKDIESGSWERSVFEGIYHDPALLFDEGRTFVIYGGGDIRITELTSDAAAVKQGGVNQLLLETQKDGIGLRCEGGKAYKINDKYYLTYIEWPTEGNQRRRQVCYRSDNLLGEYERKIILDDDMRYHNKGVAQGAFFDTADHDWYAMLFQDHDAVGRIPYIVPIKWKNGWPVLGIDGKVPDEIEVPFVPSPKSAIVISDEFNHTENKLALNWQWNHNPDNNLWSFTKHTGYLRLETGNLSDNILNARNTLTQRTEGPACTASTLIDVSHMKSGDFSGLAALQNNYGTVGIKISEEGFKYLVMSVNGGKGNDKEQEIVQFYGNQVFLKIEFDFEESKDIAEFYYSLDGDNWIKIGSELSMKYTLDHFMGYRIGLFNYASTQIGGYVDFSYFHYAVKSC